MITDSAATVPVLIVGGGASGTMQALLLAQHGIASIVVEVRADPYDIPRAHALNPRSLEICRAAGLDVAAMRRRAAPAAESGRVYFVPRLLGPILGMLSYERQDAAALDVTPTPLINIPQTELEEILFAAAASTTLITVRRSRRWMQAHREGDGIVSQVEGPDGLETIHSRYLIGCDGAGSRVRDSLGIGMSGDAAVLSCLSIVFRADLRATLADRPGMLFWTTDPAASGTFLGYHMDRLWSFVQMHPPGPIDMGVYTPEACRRIVIDAAGGDIPDLEILQITPWTMTSQVADAFGHDRIFLVGDAAHRFPPTGGLGLNTGIQDAHNLAWKIAAVEAGWAPSSLCDSYARERRPVALRNAEQSLVNAQRLAALAALRCEEAVWRDPDRFAAWLRVGDRQSLIAAAVALQADHFDSLGLQLGCCYPPAVVSDDPVGVYRPRADPGCRLPHAWIGDGTRSVLDLLDPTRFTLLADRPPGPRRDDRIHAVDLSAHAVPAAWFDLVGWTPCGALLVRPDGHVAWTGPFIQHEAALSTFLRDLSQ